MRTLPSVNLSVGVDAVHRGLLQKQRAGRLGLTAFCGGKALNTEVSTADVLKVAAAFEKWALEPEKGDEAF